MDDAELRDGRDGRCRDEKRAVGPCLRKDERELLPPVSACEVGGLPAASLQRGGDPLQARVTGLMAIGIVERLEEVDVAQEQADGIVAAPGTAQLALQSLVEFTAVGQSRETILAAGSLPVPLPRSKLRSR